MAHKLTLKKNPLSYERRTLPKFARGLAPESVTLLQLRQAVCEEIRAANRGENPLTDKQYRELSAWVALHQ